MSVSTEERALRSLAARRWDEGEHRARLARTLRVAHQGRRARRARLLRLLTGGAAPLLLAGGAFGAARLGLWDRLRVAASVDGHAAGSYEVVEDDQLSGSFRLPLSGDGRGPHRFEFEVEAEDAAWVDFDIRVEDGVARVVTHRFPELPIEPAAAASAFALARAAAERDGGALWGTSLAGPLLLVDPASRFAAADRADAGGRLRAHGDVFLGRLPDEVPIANSDVRWSGTHWTMVMWPLPGTPEERTRLLLHESFHRVQAEVLPVAGAGPCEHLSGLEARVWMRLEARALAAALRDGAAERAAVHDALLFRAARHRLVPAAGPAEDALELHEGLAEYTGLRLAGYSAQARRERAADGLERLGALPSMERSFAYATGPALGVLLDALRPEWRAELLAPAGDRPTPAALLAAAVGWRAPGDAVAAARARGADYGAAEVRRQETERWERRARRVAELRRRFVDGPLLRCPPNELQYSFDPLRVEALAEVGTVYDRLWVRGAWGTAEAARGAVLESGQTLRLPAPSDLEGPELAGDGWTLTLEPGWTVEPDGREGDFRLARAGR
ncbi:MAG: hypothetical protein AAF682_11595 [Planctomycetota bacterium]